MLFKIDYDLWVKVHEKNIKPLPSWWCNEDYRKAEYKKFESWQLTGEVK
tara:strand:- start:705 stop:851 length:147 start_codon:yes stop_codon:yes gene_type:complete